MTNEWKQLYDIACRTLNPCDLSDTVSIGGVAAAILSTSGKVYTGVCVDVCCSLGVCAERNAIFNMITANDYAIVKMVIVHREGTLMLPCGACREFIYQLMMKDAENIEILANTETGEVIKFKELVNNWWF